MRREESNVNDDNTKAPFAVSDMGELIAKKQQAYLQRETVGWGGITNSDRGGERVPLK